jgi:hypothetical protein
VNHQRAAVPRCEAGRLGLGPDQAKGVCQGFLT